MLNFGEQAYNQLVMADPLASWMWMSLTAPPPPPLTQPMANHVFVNMDALDRPILENKKVQLPSVDANVEVIDDADANSSGEDMKSDDDNFNSKEDQQSVVEDAREEDSLSDDPEEQQLAAVTTWKKDRPWIWKVHPNVRRKDEDAYEPKIVSIGPLHHGKEALKPMEDIKRMYMGLLFERSPENNTLRNYLRVVGNCEDRARKQYAEVISMWSKQFRRMLVLDGCFMIEYFLRKYFKERQIHHDYLVNVGWNLDPLQRDLMLLENQIPFFVLEELYQATVVPESKSGGTVRGDPPGLMTIALSFLRLQSIPEDKRPKPEKVHHLLHLQYICLIPRMSPRADPPPISSSILLYPFEKVKDFFWLAWYGLLYFLLIKLLGERVEYSPWSPVADKSKVSIPCATELHRFGVKFERKQLVGGDDSYLNITFSDQGVLAIPRYVVGPITISQMRNFIAFEKCHFIGNYFTEYAIFMDNIIDTVGDVGILRKYGILESTLGTDEQVAKTFNMLLEGTDISPAPDTFDSPSPSDEAQEESQWVRNRILPLFQDVNKFCDTPQNRWRASLRSSHLRSPWATFTLLAVMLGITTSLVQMVYTIKRPPR